MVKKIDKKGELAKNTLIMAVGGLSVQIVSFLLIPLYTAYLTTSAYGLVDLLTTYIILFAPVVTIQLGMASFRFLINARTSNKVRTEIITNVFYGAGLLLLAFIALSLLVLRFVHIPYQYLVLASTCATAISFTFMQIARGMDRNKIYAAGGIVTGAATAVLSITLLAGFHMGAEGVFISLASANTACAVFIFLYLKLYQYIKFKCVDKKLQRELLRYSWPLVPNGISWWVINTADRTIIAIFLGLSSNGIYAIAYKFPTVFSGLSSYFNLSWTESASLHIESKDRDQFFSDVLNASVCFFGSLAALMIAYTSLIFNIFVNARFKEAYLYIPILVAASFFSAMVGLYGAIYIAKKLTKQVGNTSIFAAAINISLTLVLIKSIGLYGTSIATVVAYFAMTIYRHYDSKKYVTILYEKNTILKVVIFYAFAVALYYYDNLAVNIINALVVSAVAVLLNRPILNILKDHVFGKLKKLSPEQEITEMSDLK
jgi:O-antigen/teichoic acid export membrane protein